jgi:O-antigen ligase/cytochrome c-type biogenesis protein CcmH/NrfG
MIEHCEREQFVNVKAGKATSSRLERSDRDLVATLKRHLFSCPLSPAVLLLGSLIIFSPLIEGGTTHLPVLIMRLILLGALITWTMYRIRLDAITLIPSRLIPVLVLFLGWAGLSLWWAPYKNPSVQWFISLLMYTVLFGVVLQGIRTTQHVRQVVMVVVGMGFCEGVLGIVQYVWLGEARAKGTFFNPNFFATYEVAVLSIALALLSGVPRSEMKRWQSVFLWSIVAITLCAFMVAQSRGALLALVTALIFIGCYRFGKIALLILIVSLVVGAVIPNPLKQRMVSVAAQDPYAFSRVDIWKNSVERIADRPLGIGLGMYKYSSFQYRFPIESSIVRYVKRAESAHNEYLQMAVELGVGGLAIFLFGIGIWGREVKVALRSELEPWERGLVTGLTGAVLGILAHSMVDSVFHEPALVILLIVCGGFVFALQSIKKPDSAQQNVPFFSHPVRVALVLLGGVVLAVLIIQPAAGWYAHERGQAEAQVGRQDLALDWFRRASLIDPGTTGYHDASARTLVQLFHQSGDPQRLVKAVEEEEQAIDLNPLDGRFPYRLGTIYGLLAEQSFSKDQRDLLLNQAAQAYDQAIHADPYSPLSYMALANIRLSQGRVEEAKLWLQRAVGTEPNYLPARTLLAELSLKAGEHEAAQSEFDAIVAVKRKYEREILSDIERQFINVDLSPLGRALNLESKQ